MRQKSVYDDARDVRDVHVRNNNLLHGDGVHDGHDTLLLNLIIQHLHLHKL